jgi:hypothetical protein
MMNLKRITLFTAYLILLSGAPAYCKYFPEPLSVEDPLLAAADTGFPAGMSASLEYGDYAFDTNYIDDFYFRLGASPVIIANGDSFAIGVNFESILLCSIVPPEQNSASIAHFWMNAVQFQYGLNAAFAIPLSGTWRPDFLIEYSRASEHPFPSRDYSPAATDILQLGLAFPAMRSDCFSATLGLDCGYHQLFDWIWQSGLPQPRISWILEPTIEAKYRLKAGLEAVGRVYPQFFIDRFSDSIAADIFAEAGIDVVKGGGRTEFLFTFYESQNSEILADEATPGLRAGFSIRFSDGRKD